MPDEGIPTLTRVIRQEEEFGHKDRVAEMREILKEIRAGWNPSELEAYSFAEVARKRAEAASVPRSRPAAEGGSPPRAAPEGGKRGGRAQRRIGHRPRCAGQAAGQGPRGDRRLGPRDPVQPRDRLQGDGAARGGREGIPDGDEKPELVVGASSMLADTLSETGDVEGAIAVLDQALAEEAITKEQQRDLRYHKAVLLSRAGREQEAGEIFIALAEEFPGYRDVDARAKRYRS